MTDSNDSDDREARDWPTADVSALATAVISVLNDKSDRNAQTARASMVRQLVRASLRPGSFNAERVLHEMRENRLASDQILDLYVPEAARVLGEMWVEDVISFADVTIASARLQGLLTLLAPPWQGEGENAGGTSALLVIQSHNSHTLGPHVVAAQFRRLGCSVRILFDTTPSDIVRAASDGGYDLLLFSCARAEDLVPVGRTIKALRRVATSLPHIVVGGRVVLTETDVKYKTGADLVSNDYRVAHKLCDPIRKTKQPSAGR